MKFIPSVLLILAASCGGSSTRPEPPEPPPPMPSLNRTFAYSYDATWEAARSAARKMGLQIIQEQRGASRGTIEARRGDGIPLNLAVQSMQAASTNVEVSSDRNDPDAFVALLDRIDLELRSVPPPAQGRILPGSTINTRTFASLDRSRAAARTALQRLGYISSPERPDASEVQLFGRRADGTTATILLAPNSFGGTDVTFIVGAEPSAANDDLARQLRDEFEKTLAPPSSN